jgi:hypothetical protein
VLSSRPIESTRSIHFGVMGEVARPGVYAATADWTLTGLIKKAGGITPEANKTVRVIRGGRLAEQLYLGSGEAPSLLPNDVIVVGARGSTEKTLRAAEANRGSNAQPTVAAASAVQIAFLNLIDRPVIVKMSSEHATLARIVELLGQPADCIADIRVLAPLGAGPRVSDSVDEATRPLESGTVLVFLAPSTRRDTLPALPEPIAETSSSQAEPDAQSKPHSGDPGNTSMLPNEKLPKESTSQPQPATAIPAVPAVASSTSLPDTKAADSALQVRQLADARPVDPVGARPAHQPEMTAELPISPEVGNHSAIDQSSRQSDISPHGESEFQQDRFAQSDGKIPATIRPAFTHPANESHAARMVLLMAAMSAVAGFAMLLTFASIAQRWMGSDKRSLRQTGTGSPDASTAVLSAGVPAPPLPAGPSRVGRPVRIDAGRATTRLSIDLAVIERMTQSSRIG